MALTTEAKVRQELLIDETTILTSARMTQFITDANEHLSDMSISDEKAERYYAAYLVSKSLKHQYVKSNLGTSYSDIDPQVFFDNFKARAKALKRGKPKKINWSKVDDGTEY